ncbi:CoxG family protein [Sporosarcina sp.]|uniref:CoxG family protein n=1 Tax=Sporosarcina sp. TaxID=49982 RepID=UPI00262169AF|nr:SRPBCC family protein [Sporosarcina sp.]
MPNGTQKEHISKPKENVWTFLQDINNWAPLIPGYIEHEVLSDDQFTWKFRADLGMMQKNIVLRVDVMEKTEASKISFNLEGLNESLDGNGYFELYEAADQTTDLTGYLDIKGKGMMGSMINTMMKNYVPQTVEELTRSIGSKAAQ